MIGREWQESHLEGRQWQRRILQRAHAGHLEDDNDHDCQDDHHEEELQAPAPVLQLLSTSSAVLAWLPCSINWPCCCMHHRLPSKVVKLTLAAMLISGCGC